jgi:PAS domain S-box-containing protein
MFTLSPRLATIFAAFVFIITIVLSYLLPEHSITYTGFLLIIFLSVFVKDNRSTLLAAIVSSVLVICFMLFHPDIWLTTTTITKHIFIVVLIYFTGLLVFHIKHLYKKLEDDKSHMTSLFENATEGIILTDRNGKIILANPSALRIFQYGEEELLGQNIDILLPHKFREGHHKLREGFYKAPANRTMGSGRDLFALRKTGENFPVEVSLSSYFQQSTQYVIAFIVDITQRKRIEESMLKQQKELEKVTSEVRRMNIELEAKVGERTVILKEALQRLELSQAELNEALNKEKELNEIKSRFVSMASHEFRTPLSAILSSASLLKKYTTTEQQPNRDKHTKRIQESVKHLNDLLEDFLSLGKLDEGKIGAMYSELDLQEVVHDIIEDMRGLAKEQQDITHQHTGPTLIESDKKMVRNIMINLVSNAIKFSDVDGRIEVRSSVDDEKAVISVSDNGIGISDHDQEHLFSSFFRGHNVTNIQGTGLGLHIVKRYVDLLNGSVNLESKLGEGTKISVTIPVNYTA